MAKKKKNKKMKETFEILWRKARSRGVYSDEMETELPARKQSALSGGNWAQLITHLIALPPRSMVVAVSCCGVLRLSRRERETLKDGGNKDWN